MSTPWKIVKYLLTVFVAILVPVYWYNYSWQNFLWLSDIGLFTTLVALWFDSILIMSMAAVGLIVLELVWWVDFFADLLFNINPITLSDYMFDSSLHLGLRVLSLFHIFIPIIWVLYLKQFGYKKTAICYASVMYWCVVLVTYLFTNSEYNINWVFMPLSLGWNMASFFWLIILSISFPIFIFLPTHFLYKKIFKLVD